MNDVHQITSSQFFFQKFLSFSLFGTCATWWFYCQRCNIFVEWQRMREEKLVKRKFNINGRSSWLKLDFSQLSNIQQTIFTLADNIFSRSCCYKMKLKRKRWIKKNSTDVFCTYCIKKRSRDILYMIIAWTTLLVWNHFELSINKILYWCWLFLHLHTNLQTQHFNVACVTPYFLYRHIVKHLN